MHLDFIKFSVTTIEIRVLIVYENQTSVLLAGLTAEEKQKCGEKTHLSALMTTRSLMGQHWELNLSCVGENLIMSVKGQTGGNFKVQSNLLGKVGTEFYY